MKRSWDSASQDGPVGHQDALSLFVSGILCPIANHGRGAFFLELVCSIHLIWQKLGKCLASPL